MEMTLFGRCTMLAAGSLSSEQTSRIFTRAANRHSKQLCSSAAGCRGDQQADRGGSCRGGCGPEGGDATAARTPRVSPTSAPLIYVPLAWLLGRVVSACAQAARLLCRTIADKSASFQKADSCGMHFAGPMTLPARRSSGNWLPQLDAKRAQCQPTCELRRGEQIGQLWLRWPDCIRCWLQTLHCTGNHEPLLKPDACATLTSKPQFTSGVRGRNSLDAHACIIAARVPDLPATGARARGLSPPGAAAVLACLLSAQAATLSPPRQNLQSLEPEAVGH